MKLRHFLIGFAATAMTVFFAFGPAMPEDNKDTEQKGHPYDFIAEIFFPHRLIITRNPPCLGGFQMFLFTCRHCPD